MLANFLFTFRLIFLSVRFFEEKQKLTFQIWFGRRNGSLSGSELYDATVRNLLYATTVVAVVVAVVDIDAKRDR